MKQVLKYNLRVIELIKENISDREISQIIYDEYGIKLSSVLIKNKRSPSYVQSVQNSVKKDEIHYVTKIIEVLKKYGSGPKSAKEISDFLHKEHSIRLSKKDVNKLIYKYLRNKTIYDRVTYQYSLKTDDQEIPFEKPENESSLEDLIGKYDNEEVLASFQSLFKEHYLKINTGHENLDYLIKSVVKDNAITECEEIFLKQKASELGLRESLIDLAKKSLYSNNPYLDNIIHIIFEDGVITNEELNFLKEKSEEHKFSKGFVNKRFWTTGISVYINHLRKIKEFDQLIFLFFLGQKLKFPSIQMEMWIFSKLNIFCRRSLEEIVQEANDQIKKDLKVFILQNTKVDPHQIFSELENKVKLKGVKSNTDFETTSPSSRSYSDILRILDCEKRRIGSTEVNLFVENIKFRIENELWD